MKKYFIPAVLGLVVGVVAILVYLVNKPGPAVTPDAASDSVLRASVSTPVSGHSPPASNSAASASGEQESLASRAGQYVAPADAPSNLPPAMVLENLRRVVHQYGAMFGGDPVGTNPEITAALSGKNPKQINFLTGQPGVNIDSSGALVDSWGTPYFFHQLSATVMEIHSAGPDKIMWTSDDLVTR